jgi:hypothetical protein
MNKLLAITLCLFTCFSSMAQIKMIIPDLSRKDNLQTVNRQLSLLTDRLGKPIVHLNANDGPGVGWINGLNFTTGIIEFDVKGKNVLQQSFVGLAFHGVNDSTYESIYFRPFNFQADDLIRKKHAVQYISLPGFDWKYLRETYPDKYEHAALAFIDPNEWFHVKIIIETNKIQVFVNTDVKACIIVEPLTNNLSGKIGFWVGQASDGDFSNLTLQYDR